MQVSPTATIHVDSSHTILSDPDAVMHKSHRNARLYIKDNPSRVCSGVFPVVTMDPTS